MVESVAKQMEYSISDWGIAQLAKKLAIMKTMNTIMKSFELQEIF